MSVSVFAAEPFEYSRLVARAVRILTSLELMDMNGHVSARDTQVGETMWINSRRASRTTLRYGDVVPVDLSSGSRIGEGDEPPSEVHIHRAIMRSRPDVGGIVHAHPDYIVALSIAGRKLLPVTGVGSFLPETVPVFDNASLINTEQQGETVASLLGEGPALVLRGHGVVVVGANVEEALARYVCAEENARIQYKASLLGEPHILRGEELAFVRRESWTPAITAKHWHYHEETAHRKGAFEGIE
ncbi:MAG: class II aldolase/adducin family protein, partial [Candidatus Dormibacteria bacterium]